MRQSPGAAVRIALLSVAVLATAAACGSDSGGGGGGSDIDPRVQEMIDTLETNRDCESLQFQFDRYDDLGDADTMEAIDAALSDAGCYG